MRPARRACRRSRRRAGRGRPRHAAIGLVENVARENLSPVEEARAYASLIDEFELSLGEVAERVGRSKPSVSNRVRLLELPEDVLWMLARGDLTEGHARAVLALPDDDARRRLARKITQDGLTVRAAEKAARDGGARRHRTVATVDPALAERARVAAHGLTGLPAGSTAASSSSSSATRPGSRSSSRCWKRSCSLDPRRVLRYTPASCGRLAQLVRAPL